MINETYCCSNIIEKFTPPLSTCPLGETQVPGTNKCCKDQSIVTGTTTCCSGNTNYLSSINRCAVACPDGFLVSEGKCCKNETTYAKEKCLSCPPGYSISDTEALCVNDNLTQNADSKERDERNGCGSTYLYRIDNMCYRCANDDYPKFNPVNKNCEIISSKATTPYLIDSTTYDYSICPQNQTKVDGYDVCCPTGTLYQSGSQTCVSCSDSNYAYNRDQGQCVLKTDLWYKPAEWEQKSNRTGCGSTYKFRIGNICYRCNQDNYTGFNTNPLEQPEDPTARRCHYTGGEWNRNDIFKYDSAYQINSSDPYDIDENTSNQTI
jgi:hypothetical protein